MTGMTKMTCAARRSVSALFPTLAAVPALPAALMLAGCMAVTSDFPGLGDPPPDTAATEGAAILPPVSLPPPARASAALDAAAVPALIAESAARLDGLAAGIAQQAVRLEAALNTAVASGSAIDRRSAHFEFSRLSRLETEAAALARRLAALPETAAAAAALQQRAEQLAADVADVLALWRPGLAALGPAQG